MSFPNTPRRVGVTTSNFKQKPYLCHGCGVRTPIVGTDADGKLKCLDCLPASRRPMMELAED